ncbi:MAG: zinc-dependent metalloprotease [Isosphaeraceae bacterium]
MTKRLLLVALCGLLIAGGGLSHLALAQEEVEDAPTPVEVRSTVRSFGRPAGGRTFQDFNELTKGAKTYEGFITLHEKDQHLYAEIKPQQLEQPILAPMVIARGSANAGQPLNFGDEWVLAFHRVGDNLQLIRKNIHFTAPSGSALEKAVKQNYTDSILMSLPILSMSPRGGALVIDFADIFMTDFGQVGLGFLDKSRSRWFKIRAYPDNVEIQVEATFSGGRFGRSSFYGGPSSVIDPRGITMVLHYSLCKAPDHGYHSRMADYRVGHFLNSVTDFANPDPDTNAKRMINRWRLEKANHGAKLSPPKKQIVWYIEDNVPEEFRPYVQEGILEWNKAFEKIGFKDAIAVRWQNERDDFEPEDINYCTLRWITTGNTFAMSGLRSNPLTGEIIDGDVIFDTSWIKTWKEEYAILAGMPIPTGVGQAADQPIGMIPLAVGEILSPIMAAKQGYGQLLPPPGSPRAAAWSASMRGENGPMGNLARGNGNVPMALDIVPAGWDPIQAQLQQRLSRGKMAGCNYAAAKAHEMQFAVLALAMAADVDPAKKDKETDKDKKKEPEKEKEKPKEKKEPEPKLPEEFLGQAIKEVVMHEVGHSLGLRHNFKASTMLRPDQINDTSITRVKGMAGSVMDYNPINVAPKGQKQGDFASTTIGPYDYWAIEYAYTQVMGDEKAELKKIAARSPDPELAFGTDDDFYNNDPEVNTYDLTSDTLAYGKMRMAMAGEMLKDLDKKVVKDGDSWARLRSAFVSCIQQFGNGAYLAAEYIGGQSVNRDFKGTDKARDPVKPIAGARQREALKLLVDQILSDKAFRFSPALLRKLITESWQDEGFYRSGSEYPIYRVILNLQDIALDQCLDPGVLQRIQNHEMQSDPGSDPMKIAEVFRSLSDGIFTELAAAPSGTAPFAISTIRRNLQREYIKRLSSMVLGPKNNSSIGGLGYIIFLGGQSTPPSDAKNLARLHLDEVGKKIDTLVNRKDLKIDDTTLAHLKEIQFRIAKVLNANLNVNEP